MKTKKTANKAETSPKGKQQEIVIDATGTVLGRLATYTAKQAILGKTIKIINCNTAIILGRKADILKKYKQRKARGSVTKGPFIQKAPEKIVRRTIRGMLPYKKASGRAALRRIKCYPTSSTIQKKAISLKQLKKTGKHITIEELSKLM